MYFSEQKIIDFHFTDEETNAFEKVIGTFEKISAGLEFESIQTKDNVYGVISQEDFEKTLDILHLINKNTSWVVK